MSDKQPTKRKRNGFQASEYIPEGRIVDIAEDRTADIVRVWASQAVWKPLDFHVLARSCYMQGVNDCTDSVAMIGLGIPRQHNIEVGG